jgi:PAS domain S-box-containing protein
VLAIDLADDDMRIRFASRLVEEVFSYGQGELSDKRLDVLLEPKDVVTHHRYFKNFRADPKDRTMNAGVWVNGIKKDRSVIKVQVSLCVREVGKRTFVLACLADVTKAYDRMKPVITSAAG